MLIHIDSLLWPCVVLVVSHLGFQHGILVLIAPVPGLVFLLLLRVTEQFLFFKILPTLKLSARTYGEDGIEINTNNKPTDITTS